MTACLSGLHDAVELDGVPAGLVTYRVADAECEVVTLHSVIPGSGAGTAVLEAVARLARDRGCRRAWLTTTNDNLPALRFYQRRGWDLVAFHRDAVTDWCQRLKPEIPMLGPDGSPIRHAFEFELLL